MSSWVKSPHYAPDKSRRGDPQDYAKYLPLSRVAARYNPLNNSDRVVQYCISQSQGEPTMSTARWHRVSCRSATVFYALPVCHSISDSLRAYRLASVITETLATSLEKAGCTACRHQGEPSRIARGESLVYRKGRCPDWPEKSLKTDTSRILSEIKVQERTHCCKNHGDAPSRFLRGRRRGVFFKQPGQRERAVDQRKDGEQGGYPDSRFHPAAPSLQAQKLHLPLGRC